MHRLCDFAKKLLSRALIFLVQLDPHIYQISRAAEK